MQAGLHLPVLPHATGDEFSPGLEAGDEKTPPFGGLAGDGVEGFAPAEGNTGEAAPLAPAGGVREVLGDPAAPGFEASVTSFGLFQIVGTTGGEGGGERMNFVFGCGLVAFEIEDIVATLGVDKTSEAVLAAGGIATGDDAFKLEMAQEQFALGALAAGFGNAAPSQAEAFFDAPQIDRGRHVQGSGLAPAAALEGDDSAQPRGFIPSEIGHVLEGMAAGEQTAEGDEEQIGEGVLRPALVAGIGNQPQRMMQQGRWRDRQGACQFGELIHWTDTPAPAFSSKSAAFVKSWKNPSWKTSFALPLIA